MSRAIFGKGELSSGIPLEKANFPPEFRWKHKRFPLEKVLPSLFPCGYIEPPNSASAMEVAQWQLTQHLNHLRSA